MAQSVSYRPNFHFTPPQGWMNDPNGLVFFQGEYHLFYQHNPKAEVWGPMHWGHAISTDLVNWQHLPIALFPDDLGTIFSGSAVVDWEDTTGFGRAALILIFTHHHETGQRQSLAYSLDRGRTWTMHPGNPVLHAPDDRKDFRDPKVFWYESGPGAGHWVMVVAAGHEILFYTSPDLIHWELASSFGADHKIEGVWETPDLFSLVPEGAAKPRWVLTAGALGEHSIAGGTGMRYFTGDFDGRTFTSDNPVDTELWVDYGADFYAAQSWSNLPEDRRIWIGWLNNWQYARNTPTTGWRGAFSVPRELGLLQTPAGPRLVQRPIPELRLLLGTPKTFQPQVVTEGSPLVVGETGPAFEVKAKFLPAPTATPDRYGLRLHFGAEATTTVGYDETTGTYFLDRLHSGLTEFHAGFGTIHVARNPAPQPAVIDFHLLVDRSSIEVFAREGQIVFSELIFPASTEVAIEVFSEGSPIQLDEFKITPFERQPE